MDEFGLIPEALRETISRVRAAGKRIKFLYTVPTFSNPAGVTLTWERRLEILEICRSNDILVLEDNPYGLLYFDGPPPHAMRSVEEDGVIYLGTFSKTLAPGFRVGWALAPHAIREKLILANEAAVLSPELVHPADHLRVPVHRGLARADRHLPRRLPRASRRDASGPRRLPARPELDRPQRRLLRLGHPAREPGLEVDAPESREGARRLHPGTAFYADGNGRNKMRLSFCYPTPDFIREGIRRLSTVINGELELLNTFSQTAPLPVQRPQSSISPPA